jgi:UPF0716 family protein affecting phage T7 exclusion
MNRPPIIIHSAIASAAGYLIYLLLDKYTPGVFSVISGLLLFSTFAILFIALKVAGEYSLRNKHKGINAEDDEPSINQEINNISFSVATLSLAAILMFISWSFGGTEKTVKLHQEESTVHATQQLKK